MIFGDPRLPARFWDKVIPEPNTGCWLWLGTSNAAGYGKFWWRDKKLYSHRVSYTVLVRPIAKGLTIDHLCRTPGCANPEHLEPVSIGENLRRAPSVTKQFCVNGHERTADNTEVQTTGWKKCRVCKNERQTARYYIYLDAGVCGRCHKAPRRPDRATCAKCGTR